MDPAYPDALPAQTRLHWYAIERVLGQGGFGITYLARDSNLDQRVAIKEYLPVEFATRTADFTIRSRTDALRERYRWGLERFLQEARTLARFEHPNIVRVLSVFEFNNTAYMVMRFEEGASLAAVLDRRGTLPEAELTGVVLPILDGLELIHAAGFIHRDIKPDNIYIRGNGQPVLLDFGSARQAAGSSDTLTILVAPGYAPFEQYYSDSGNQGPWTDIYALAATCYRAIAGRAPLDAVARSKGVLGSTQESMTPASIVGAGRYSAQFLAAIDHALAFAERDRPQSIAEWRRELGGEQPAPVARAAFPASPVAEAPQAERATTRLASAPPPAATRLPTAPPAAEPSAQARGWFGRTSTLAVMALVGGLVAVIAVGAYWLAGWRKDATAEISALRQELVKNRDRVTAQAAEQPVRQAEPPPVAKEAPAVDAAPKPATKEPPAVEATPKPAPREAPVQEARPKPAPAATPPAAKPPPKEKGATAAKPEQRPTPAPIPAGAPSSATPRPEPAPGVVVSSPASPAPQAAPKPEPEPAQVAATPPKPAPKPAESDPLAEARRDYDAGRHEDAVRKARPLAEKGNPGAQIILGDAHATGRGATRSVDDAARWFERAALQGNVYAMQWLGGHFAAQDNRYMAFVWYGCAAKLGAPQAQRARDQLLGSLQPYDQGNAERAIAACVSKGKAS